MDIAAITTKFWKLIDHNPALTVAIVLTVVMSGCDFAGKTTSPFTGQQATAEEIKLQAEAKLDSLGVQRTMLTKTIADATISLGMIGADEEVVVTRGQDAITVAEEKTERTNAWLKGLGTLLGNSIPGLPPGTIPMLFGGALGLDRVRTGLQIRKIKRNGTTAPA